MAQQIVGKIPDFTEEIPAPEPVQEEVKETEEVIPDVIETETPAPPAEKPLDEIQVGTEPSHVVETPEAKAIAGLQQERVNLLKEISELRGQKREIKQDQLAAVNKQIDELKDLHPDDVNVIDRVLRAKGYMTAEEAKGMFYENVRQTELNKFLERYPEYKPENDPGDANWSALQRELGYYAKPSDPYKITEILERAHRMVVKVPSGPSLPAQQRRLEVASHGSGGAQRPSPSGKTLDPDKRAMFRQGGWSEEEIANMEKRLQ